MKHSIIFDNCENHWDNALPLGNGVFGCMLFFERDKLYMPMNHYEVYYNISDAVLPDDKLNNLPECKNPGEQHRKYKERADANIPPDGEPHCFYKADRTSAFGDDRYRINLLANTYPRTGELVFSFSDKLKGTESKLTLYVEDAKVDLTLGKENEKVKLETFIAREDCIVSTISQTEIGLLEKVRISFPAYRRTEKYAVGTHITEEMEFAADKRNVPDITYSQLDNQTVIYTVSYALSEKKCFTFSGAVRFSGADVAIEETVCNDAVLRIENAGKNFRIFTGVFTDWNYSDTRDAAYRNACSFDEQYDRLIAEHKKYWDEFFARSSITLPDKFLEKVYVINQYALDCCSGRDGVMKHHACGLNGLWAVRHPNLWGSMWYWDVNIQAAFAGVFSSNRLELARVFSDGLRSYEKLAERSANDLHSLTGVASDYPYAFYYSCWTWCAQYLWYLYEYSLDKEYLKNEAYPLFLKLCEFTLGIFEYDSKRDVYSVYPDVCPEQGPLSHDTTITVSCAKYLFEFTLEAAKIIEDTAPVLGKVKEVLGKMPEYAVTVDGKYGVHLKDSPDAPDNLWLRHPSLLMPVFPIGELDITSDSKTVEIISNTIDFLEDNCEIGIFGGSWIAAAAARIGRGQTALRLLYERGIDHMLRTNGLSAEDTERFTNFCLIGRQPLYYPCMMEFTGEMLAAVNEMLLQSHNGIIRIFPALPDGQRDFGRAVRNGDSISNYVEYYKDYDAWKDVRFDKLLAKGAFEVSASMSNGVLEWISVHSKKGGKVSITSPYLSEKYAVFCDGKRAEFSFENGIISFETQVGGDCVISAVDVNVSGCTEKKYDNAVSQHLTYTRRLISIGENKETVYRRTLDRFTRDWYLGNVRMSNRTVYKFDFSVRSSKEYSSAFPMQYFANQGHGMNVLDIIRIGAWKFTFGRGYGFSDCAGVKITERNGPDALRCDFAEGETAAEFIIEAPRGQYELLLVSGDSEEDSLTVISCENSRTVGGKVVPAGEYQCEMIPVIQQYDEPIRIKISTKAGYKWKLNCIMLNLVKGY